ncbi:MAG TPA: NrsF family protein [Bryobacteraceae bacterium]
MRDREIDEILKQAAQAAQGPDPALLDRVAASLGPSIRPVRPLPPAWLLATVLALACAAVALAGALRLGLAGLQKLSGLERAVIFPALAILICLTAIACTAEMIPGSRRLLAPSSLAWAGIAVLLAVFAALFRDYQTSDFVHQGVVCLTAGVLHAIPTGLAAWLLLRRGYAVNPVGAGLLAGLLAGWAGVAMLELHCANFQALHVMLWHTAVLAVSGAAGALLGRFRSR